MGDRMDLASLAARVQQQFLGLPISLFPSWVEHGPETDVVVLLGFRASIPVGWDDGAAIRVQACMAETTVKQTRAVCARSRTCSIVALRSSVTRPVRPRGLWVP